MSKTIKTVYDANKSAGNDPSKNYLIPTQDEANPTAEIALDLDQIAAAVSTRIGVSPPPEPTENLAQLVITIQDNTLVPNLQTVTGVDYTHYNVVTDSETVPTYPTGFSEGPLPALLPALANYAPETKYVYLYDLPTATQKTLTAPDGTSGIIVLPNDTINPVVSLAGVKSSGEPGTEVDYTLTASDAQSGIDESRTQAFSTATLQPITAEGIAPLTGGVGTVTLTFNPGESTDVFFRVWDNDNNFTDTPPVQVDLDDPVDTNAGVVTIDETANPIAAITQAESTTPLTVTVNLTGNTDSNAKTAQIALRKWTCETSGQVDTALPGSPAGTVTITPPATSNTLDITVTNVNDGEDNRFEAYIADVGAAAGDDPLIGTNNAIYCDLTGTGGASTGVYQLTVDTPQVGEYFGFIDADMAWSFTADYNNKNYVADPSYAACIADGGVDDSVINDGAGGGAGAGTAPTQCFYVESGAVNETTYTNFLVEPTNTARAVITVNFPVSGNYYFWLRQSRSTTNYSAWITIDGLTPSAADEFVIYDHTVDVWDFSPLCLKNTDKNTPVAKYITAGEHTVEVSVREATPSLYWNRLHITTDSTHNPSAAGTGPNLTAAATEPAATLPSSSTTPDPDNPTTLPPMGLIPATTLAPTLYPLDDTIDQPANLILSFKYGPDVTGIQIYPYAITVTSGGSPVAGKWTTNGVNEAYFTTSSGAPVALGTDAAVSITGAATEVGIVYDSGVKKAIDITADGTWSFVTEASSSASQFTNVPIPNGGMDYTWYATAASKFTTGTDDPVDWPALYAAATRVVPVTTQLGLQTALNVALPGDFILISGTQPIWDIISTLVITQPGTESEPIVICPEYKALGTSNPVIFANGSQCIAMSHKASWNIIGGLTFRNFSRKAIDLSSGLTLFTNGATDVRITDNIFDSCGKAVGSLDGLIKVGDRCHRTRIDHNQVINPYNAIRIKYSDDSITSPSLGIKVDHNYFGPVPTTGLVDGVTYDCGACQWIGDSQPPSSGIDMDSIFEYNVIEQPTNANTEEEMVEVKANGVMVRYNICFGSEPQQRLALRYSSRSTIQSNYCVGVGVKSFGDTNTLHDNYIDGNGTLRRGVHVARCRRRQYPNCNFLPHQIDVTITNNTVRGCITSAISVAKDDFGAVYLIDGATINNNDVSTAAGVTGVAGSGTSNEYWPTWPDAPDSQYVGCSSYTSGYDNLGGQNIDALGNPLGSAYVKTNTYSPASGTLYDIDLQDGGAAGSSVA